MIPNHSDRSVSNAARADAEWAGAGLSRECERQARQYYNFSEFRGLTPQQIIHPDPVLAQNPKYKVLRQIIMLMKSRMTDMNKQDRAIPNDSIESLLDKMTRPSSEVVAIVDNIYAANSPVHVAGFALVVTDPKDVPDLDEIPDKLKQGPFVRLLRVAVDPKCKRFGASGAVIAKLLDGVDTIADGRPIVAMILLGHYPSDKPIHPVWLEARNAFIGAPGSERAKHPHFEDAGHAHVQTFKHSDGEETTLFFGWFVRNPSSESIQKAYQAYKAHYRKLRVGVQRRLAEISPHVPSNGAFILSYSADLDGHQLGAMFPGNTVIEVCAGAHPETPPGMERLSNVKVVQGASPRSYFVRRDFFDLIYDPPLGLDGADVMPDRALDHMLRLQISQLKDYGVLIIDGPADKAERERLEARLGRLGMRILASHPKRPDPGKARLVWRIIAEKVPPSEGVSLAQLREVTGPLKNSRLRLVGYSRENGKGREIVEHKLELFGIVPWYRHRGKVKVVMKSSDPRPIIVTASAGLDGARHPGYINEIIGRTEKVRRRLRESELLAMTVKTLEKRAGIDASQLKSFDASTLTRHFTAPRDLSDEVASLLVEVEPFDGRKNPRAPRLRSRCSVQGVDAEQILRACQRGKMSDGRLERKVYELLIREKEHFRHWIGTEPSFQLQTGLPVKPEDVVNLLTNQPKERLFRRIKDYQPQHYEVVRGTFAETDIRGEPIATIDLDYVRRSAKDERTSNAASVLPVVYTQVEGSNEPELCVLLDLVDSPVAQERLGTPKIPCAVAFHLPPEVTTHDQMKAYIKERIETQGGFEVLQVTQEGGSYFVSPRIGATRLYPHCAEVSLASALKSGHKLVRLKDLLAHADKIKDANLLTLTYRLSHAAGLLA